MNQSELGPVLGKLVAGLYIVSLKNGENEAGFLASWIQQAGFNPPMLSIAFNKDRKYHFSLFTGSGHLVVNIMAKENSKTMARFFKPAPEKGSIFDELETFTSSDGVPVLKDSLGYLECKYRSEVESGDHIIVLCEITGGKLLNTDLQPSVHIRADGFKY